MAWQRQRVNFSLTRSQPVWLNPDDAPAWKGSLSAREEIVAPDGHVVLSKEDISARA
jgi:hypothetical protein